MVVVYKPAGWLVHRTAIARHETRFVLQTLRDQIGQHVSPCTAWTKAPAVCWCLR